MRVHAAAGTRRSVDGAGRAVAGCGFPRRIDDLLYFVEDVPVEGPEQCPIDVQGVAWNRMLVRAWLSRVNAVSAV